MNKFVFFALFLFIGCSKHFDHFENVDRRITNSYYDLTISENENIFTYTSNIGLRLDTHTVKGTKFKLNITKKLMYYRIDNIADFTFSYPHGQYLLIHIDNEKKAISPKDTLYEISPKECRYFMEQHQNSNFTSTKIKKVMFEYSRKSFIFRRKNVTIFLCKIKKNNVNFFLTSAQSLKLI